MKKSLLLFLLLPYVLSFSQNIDSLYNEFLLIREVKQFVKPQQVTDIVEPTKCGFGIVNQVKLNYDKFSALQKNVISSLLQRPSTDTSFISPKGWFRIHYNKTGNDAPGYDMKELAKAADSSYNYEVNILAYPPPPSDQGVGGDDRFDIYILNLPGGDYGYTEAENRITDSTYTSFSVIDNDFGSYYNTHGINAARVTLAHEFHHGIQMGNYIFRPQDLYYHEITSTSMEEFVYNDVNDYYYYMDTFFRYPHKAFSSYYDLGYSRAIWNIFLRDRFGVNIIKKIWELMPKERALKAFAEAISQAGSDFKVEFNKFGLWIYFTNIRVAIPNKYFKEASNYPLIKALMTTQFTAPTTTLSVSSEAVSNNFLVIRDNSNSPADTLVSIITNCDIDGGTKTPIPNLDFNYSVSTQKISNRNILNKYYTKYESNNNFLLLESNILDNIPVEGFSTVDLNYVFPQPFRYSSNTELNFPTVINSDAVADLFIYSSSMNLVYLGQKRIVINNKVYVSWNALDYQNKKLATGVYLYVIKSGEIINKGKFVIYND